MAVGSTSSRLDPLLPGSNHFLSGSTPTFEPSPQPLTGFPSPSLETATMTPSSTYWTFVTQRSRYGKQAPTGTSAFRLMETSSQVSPGTAFLSGDTFPAVMPGGGNSDRVQPHFNSRRPRRQSWAVPAIFSMYYIWIIPRQLSRINLLFRPRVYRGMPILPTVPTLRPRTAGKVRSRSPTSVLKTPPLPNSLTRIWRYQKSSSPATFSWRRVQTRL